MNNFLKCTRKKKNIGKFFPFVIFYFAPKQRFLSISEQILSLHSYCGTKMKLCIKISCLTAGKAVEKTHWETMQPYVWIETEHTLFCLFEKTNIDLFSTTKYWLLYNSWNECQRKTSAKCQKGCQVCDKYTFPLTLRSRPHPLEQINLSWMLDFCIWDENQSLISLTGQGCNMLWQQNAITLTLTAGNGVGLAESV